jgi:ribosomal-protein-serine acetyltransferase
MPTTPALPPSPQPALREALSLQVDPALLVRPLGPDDARAWYEAVAENRPHLARWIRSAPAVASVEEATRLIAERQVRTASREEVYVGLWHQGRMAGSISVRVDWREHSAEFGYWLGEALQGQGLMTRACQAVIGVLFSRGLHRIEIRCATENAASRRIPERLGFTLEGTLRHTQRLNGNFVDHAVYGLLASEDRLAPPP